MDIVLNNNILRISFLNEIRSNLRPKTGPPTYPPPSPPGFTGRMVFKRKILRKNLPRLWLLIIRVFKLTHADWEIPFPIIVSRFIQIRWSVQILNTVLKGKSVSSHATDLQFLLWLSPWQGTLNAFLKSDWEGFFSFKSSLEIISHNISHLLQML